MAAKKSSKKKSVRTKKAEPRKAAKKKSPPRKATRSTAKASSKAAPKAAPKATRAKVAPAKPKKAASVRAKPKKTASVRAKTAPPVKAKKASASQRPRSTVNGVHRRDRAGHLDPKYAADLRAKSIEGREASNDSAAFVRGSKSGDALAEELGQEAVETMTTGEDEGNESRDEFAEEEIGGPFVESSAKNEFADDSDESNPDDATREPFPKT